MADIGIRISAVDDTRPAFDSVGRSLAGVQTGAAAANKAVAQMGVSAAQTAAAMRSVPAQFTDIVVGLQSGQAPLTVLLQQGGQLKDMFGGIGNAARALGGYITSLLTPLNLTIAAVGALGFAYYKGTQESSEYNKALILTGNAAGTTSGQMADMAANMARVGVSQGAAAQALAAFATTGQIAAASMEKFSLAAVKYASATGIAVEDTVKQFVELGKAPLEASVKLDESANHLTLTLYEQIKALDAQGRHTEAATLAQNTFADTLSSRSAEMVSKLGLIERAWAGIKKEVSEVVNFAAGIGRDTGLGEQVNAQQLRVTNAQNNLNYVQRSGFGAAKVQAYQDELQVERDKLEVLRETARMVSRSAAARAQEVKSVKDQIEFDKEAAKYKTNAVKLQEELNRLAEKYAQVTHDGELGARNTAAYKVAVEKVRDQYKDKDVPKKIVDLGTYDSLIRSIREKIEVQEQELTGVEKLTKGEREQAKFLADLRDGTTGLVALRGKSIQQQAAEIVQAHQTNIALEKQNEVIAQAAAMRESAARAFDAYNKKQADETAAIIARAQSVEDEVAAYGLTKEALRQLTIARLEEQAAQITRFEPADVAQREVAAIEERIAALKRLGAAETSLAAKDAAAKAASHAEQEWKRAAGRINDSITDALMRGFESGKGFAENLRDTVVNMFKTMVLRPTVSAIVNPVAQGVTGMLGMSGTANAAGGMSQLGGALGTLTLGGSTIAAIGSSVATGISAGLAGTSLTGATAAYSAAGMSGVAGGLGFGSAIGSGLAAIGPVGWAALAALAAVQLFKGNGGTPTANTGNASASYDRLGNRTDYQTYYGGSSAAVDKMLASLQDSYTKAAQALGIGAAATRFSYGGNTGKNGESPNFALGGGAGSVNFYQGETTSSDAAIALAAQRAVFAALQGSELPQYLARMFDGLSASNMTQEQIAGTLAYAQSVKQVREALLETREPLQILKDNVAAGLAALSTSSETFKTDFVAAIDAGISPEKLAQWQGLQNAMTELAAASGKASDSVKDVSRSIADIANERQRLQDQLDDLTMTSTELLAKQRAAIDASNRSLFDQVQAAQTARNTLDQRNALEEQLLQLQGNTAELRRRELESIEPSNRALQASIYALQDAKDAQDAYNTALSNAQGRLASATAALESAQNAVDAIRNSGTDQYLSALQQVAQAQDAIASAAQQATQKMAQLGQSLRDFVTREVLSSAAGTPSIAVANQAFARTLALARAGDTAAISDLESKGRTALDAARAGSTSGAQYQSIRNMVLQGVASVAANLPALSAQDQSADLQKRLIDAQTELAEALRVANAIGAPLQRAQNDLITRFAAAQTALASAQADYATASAVLDAIKTNTAQTAANVQALNGNLVVQLQASAQSEITKLITVIGDDSALSPDIKELVLMESESIRKYIDLIATSALTPDLKALALMETTNIVKSLDLIAHSSLTPDLKVLALMESESISKAIALIANSALTDDQKTLALMGSASVSKYISLIANSSLSTDDKTLALMASNTIVKTIVAALGANDSTALSIALARSDTLTRTISAVGGTLTDDQRTVLQALTGASSVSVSVSGTTTANVTFDPADPVRSVWQAIRTASEQSAGYAYGIHSALSWIASMVSNMLNHASTVRIVFDRGATPGGPVFAKGGVFTNRIVDAPTTFDMGLMGEAGPEAIMPLHRGADGSLGVVATLDYQQFGRGNEALVNEIRSLREENRAQASAIVGLNQRMTKLMERWDGNGLPSTRVEA